MSDRLSPGDAAPDFTGPEIESARREGRTLSLDAATALALGSA